MKNKYTLTLYHGNHGATKFDPVMSHYGSFRSAAHRLDSKFARKNVCAFTQEQDPLLLFDEKFRRNGQITVADYMKRFSDFMSTHTIQEVSVNIQNPLQIHDCWDDDPIGSGALALFQDNRTLIEAHKKELATLFSPFRSVIYPEHITVSYSMQDIQKIEKKYMNDPLFKSEIQKRQKRAKALKLDYNYERPFEIVWTKLSIDLRNWALKNNFDSFCYKNDAEGDGELSFVCLKDKQAKTTSNLYSFNKELYLAEIEQSLDQFLENLTPQNTSEWLWMGKDPCNFFTLSPRR